MSTDAVPPTLAEIRAARQRLGDLVVETPIWRWRGREITDHLDGDTQVVLKLELFQHTGTFKPRGALTVMMALDAVGYAARVLGTTAKVVMPRTANPARVAACRWWGAEVDLVDDVHRAFERVREIEAAEGRTFVHPFEGPRTALGTATLGLELATQAPDLDAVIVPIGGGGLCAGVATAIKLALPRCQIFGVEPEGADSMHRSLAAGKPQSIEAVRTIADSLGAPHAAPYSFELCRRALDDLVLVSDDDLRRAMGLLFRGVKLAVEPAGAAATAALLGPLRERLRGRRVGAIVCGTNIDPATFARLVSVEP